MSLRARLLIAVGAVALIALVVADVATYSALRSFLYDRVDQSLDSAHYQLEQALKGDRHLGRGRVGNLAPGTFVQIRGPDDAVLAETPARLIGGRPVTPKLPARIEGLTAADGPDDDRVPGPPGVGAPGGGKGTRTYLNVGSSHAGGPQFRARVSKLSNGSQLIVAVPLDDTRETLRRLVTIELAVTGAALLAAALVGWWLVRVGLRPLSNIEHTAVAIADGDLNRRVPGESTTTEVGRLAGALNVMLGRIQGAFAARDATEAELRQSEQRLRRFVADASHELRTPVAAVAAYAELFERGANVRPDDLARVMSGIRAETSRMGDLVADLLLLARLDEGRPLQRQSVELVSLAAEAVNAAHAVGPAWPIRLDAQQPVEVLGDPGRLRQVLDNLLANVRAHTPPGTSVVVRVTSDGRSAALEVVDNGPGLAPDAAGRVFERFYRVDESRSRDSGGAGLGLAIVAAIAGAHGGTVSTANVAGGGASFIVRLPLGSPPPVER